MADIYVREQQFRLNQSLANVSIPDSLTSSRPKVELGGEINGIEEATNGDVLERTPVDQKVEDAFVEELKKALFLDSNNEFIPGAKLEEFINKKATDPALKEKINKYIEGINKLTPEQYLEKLDDPRGMDKLEKTLIEIYARAQMIDAEKKLYKYLSLDMSSKTADKIKHIKSGKYLDKDGTLKSLGFSKYPTNEYQKYALAHYEYHQQEKENAVLDVKYREKFKQAILAISKKEGDKGRLYDVRFDEHLAQEVINYLNHENNNSGQKPIDKEFEKYIKNNIGIIKVAQRHDAVMARRDELKHVTRDELESKLDKATIKSLETYLTSHPGTEDGTYDLSEISSIIEERVGKDYFVNRNDDPSKTLWEVHQVRAGLAAEHHIVDKEFFDKENTYTQTEDLIKFCGFEMESKDHTPRLFKTLEDAVKGAGAGVLAHIAAPQIREIEINDFLSTQQHQIVTVGGVTVTMQELVNDLQTERRYINLMDFADLAALDGALISVGVGILCDLIIGNGICFEKECFNKSDFDSKNSTYTNKANFIRYIQERDMVNGTDDFHKIEFLLNKFPADADGKWDYDGFLNELRTIAGRGSNLNCWEIIGAWLFGDEKEQKPEPTSAIPSGVLYVEEAQKEELEKIEENYKISLQRSEEDETPVNVNRSDWGMILGLYPCLAEKMGDIPGKNPVRSKRAIAIIQGITDGNYDDVDRLNRLVTWSLNPTPENIENLQNEPGFNWEIARKHYKHYQTHRKLPRSIAGCERGPLTITSSKSTPSELRTTNKYTVDNTPAAKKKVEENLQIPAKRLTEVPKGKPKTGGAYAKTSKGDAGRFEKEEYAREFLEIKGISEDNINVMNDYDEFMKKYTEEDK